MKNIVHIITPSTPLSDDVTVFRICLRPLDMFNMRVQRKARSMVTFTVTLNSRSNPTKKIDAIVTTKSNTLELKRR